MQHSYSRAVLAALVASLAIFFAAAPGPARAAAPQYGSAFRTCANDVGGQRMVVQTTPGLTCFEAVTITKKAGRVDGDDGGRFFYASTYWQCVTVARPDDGQHTEFGCYENHAGDGPMLVKVTIFEQAD